MKKYRIYYTLSYIYTILYYIIYYKKLVNCVFLGGAICE